MAKQVNYYEVLGVPRSASREEIRSSYRHLAKEQHPDHPGGSQERFALLQEAHAVLSDPNRRKKHDEDLDLAYAADQLEGLDFSSLDDELASRRRQHQQESEEPGFGEKLRNRFRRKERPEEPPQRNRRRSDRERQRGRYVEREARWYEPHDFDPEPITWASGAITFVAAFLGFILIGQIGLWATGAANPGSLAGIQVIAPFLPVLYVLAGLVAAYFSYRAAGYVALALVFIAALVVGGQGGPQGFLQFTTLGIVLLLIVIYLGTRRDRAAREGRR